MREMTGVWNLGILLRSSRKRLELSSAILSTGGSGPSSAPGELSCSALSPEGRRGANWERPLSGKLQPRVGCLPRSPPPPGSCEGPERKRARREISPSLCNFPSLHATWCYKSLRLLWKEARGLHPGSCPERKYLPFARAPVVVVVQPPFR